MPLLTTAAGRFCYFHENAAVANNPPTITQVSFYFYYPGTTGAQPYTDFTDTHSVSYSWTLRNSLSSTGSKPSIVATGSGTPTGTDNITYTGSTVVSRWYWYTVTVTNPYGTATYTTSIIQNH